MADIGGDIEWSDVSTGGPSNLVFDYPLIQTGSHVRVDLNAMLLNIDGSLVYIEDGDILLRLPL